MVCVKSTHIKNDDAALMVLNCQRVDCCITCIKCEDASICEKVAKCEKY